MVREGLSEEDKQKLKEEIVKLGIKTINNAKRFAPVDTGRLRASITISDNTGLIETPGPEALPGDEVEATNDNFTVKVGTNVSYAEFVEFGTSTQDSQPFLRPAKDQALREINLDT